MADYAVTNGLKTLMSEAKLNMTGPTNIDKFLEFNLCLHEHLFVSFNALVHNFMLSLISLAYVYHATLSLQKPLAPSQTSQEHMRNYTSRLSSGLLRLWSKPIRS